MNKTPIEWTHRPGTVGMTWNPIHFRRTDNTAADFSSKTGNMCTRISPGCTHCYASTLNTRWGNRLEYTVENLSKGHFYLDEHELQAPLKMKKPATIFVGDMFDLFHEAIPDEMIAKVWSTLVLADWHTFQVLTKRVERLQQMLKHAMWFWELFPEKRGRPATWPLPNVWLGVSVESQKYADERIPLLLQTPAAVRFLSVEPQLESVALRTHWLFDGFPKHIGSDGHAVGHPTRLHWVICGGESGPGARPFNLAWAESLRDQCKPAGVAFFMKQVGSNCIFRDNTPKVGPETYCVETDEQIAIAATALERELTCYHRLATKDRKGGDPSEWPESLRVREWPA